MVKDFAGREFGVLVLPRALPQERVAHIMAFFQREGEPEVSKLHLGVNLFRRAKEAGIYAPTVAADSWCFLSWFAKSLLEIEGIKPVVSILKANQVVSFARERMERAHGGFELWNIHGLKFRHERAKGFKWAFVRAVTEGLWAVRLVLVRELDMKRPWRFIAEYVVVWTGDNWSPLKLVDGLPRVPGDGRPPPDEPRAG